MSNPNKYNADDIRRYLDGKMSPGEMHALERAALDDPFLADAIEGIRGHGDKEKFYAESRELKERLNERVKKRTKVVLFPLLWKVAAVLLIVITGVAIIVYTSEKNQITESEIAQTQNKKPSVPAPARERSPDTVPLSSVLVDSEFKKQPVDVRRTKPAPPETKVTDSALVVLEPETLDKTEEQAQSSQLVTVYGVTKDKKADSVTEALAERADGVAFSPARVRQKNDRNYFRAKPGDKLYVDDTSRINVKPRGGWENLEKRIVEKLSTINIDSTEHGYVQLSFLVHKGSVENIIVEKSLSARLDQEAISLIRAVPSWRVIKGKSRKVNVAIIF